MSLIQKIRQIVYEIFSKKSNEYNLRRFMLYFMYYVCALLLQQMFDMLITYDTPCAYTMYNVYMHKGCGTFLNISFRWAFDSSGPGDFKTIFIL